MATNLQTSSEPSLASIVSGIIGDFQELIKQQMDLFKTEVSEELRKTREALATLVIGLIVLFLGAALLSVMLVHLLGWLLPNMPLWVCYLLVGGGISAVGGILTGVAWKQFQSFHAVPEQSVEALKENLEWKTKPN